MLPALPAVIALTDQAWFDHFRPHDGLVVVDEVNFWRPLAQTQFRALEPGQPFFFRLKAPTNAIAGFGFFAVQAQTSVAMAWELFGTKNGDPTFERFLDRITGYRGRAGAAAGASALPLTCIVLRHAVFLPQDRRIPWGDQEGWARNIVAYKSYDMAEAPADRLRDLLAAGNGAPVPDLSDSFRLVAEDRAPYVTMTERQREGQGTFRLRLIDAYQGHCAITGEHALPVLDAAHIQPYLGPQSNHVQNGLLLRTDLHRLYDAGYVSVAPTLEFLVSPRLKEEFDNGRSYYELAGRRVAEPRDVGKQPSREALEWHASVVFR